MNRFLAALLCACVFASGLTDTASATDARSATKPTRIIEITTTSAQSDGTRIVQTRRLSGSEAETLGLFGGVAAENAASGAPPLPDPPLPGSVPPGTTRVDYHQELDGWTRDTSFGRVHGGPWELMNDHLIRNEPPQCPPYDDDCGRVPN